MDGWLKDSIALTACQADRLLKRGHSSGFREVLLAEVCPHTFLNNCKGKSPALLVPTMFQCTDISGISGKKLIELRSPVSRVFPVAINNCVPNSMPSKYETWFPQAALAIILMSGVGDEN
jgi:hypothetical protein